MDKRAVKKAISHLPLRTKLIILAVIAVLFSILFPIISNITGSRFGTSVGAAVGSFRAVTEDAPAAYHQGKRAGLSAEDTRADMQERIREVGKLDVLVAHARITDIHKVGNKYSALYELGADVIFSVDFSEASVLVGEGTVEVIFPKPVADVNVDSTQTRLKEVIQKSLLPGSAKDGMDTFFNSMDKIQDNAKDAIEGYDALEKKAEQSARNEAEKLIGLTTDKGTKITIRFEQKAGENK